MADNLSDLHDSFRGKSTNLLLQAVALVKWHSQTAWQVAELCSSAALYSLPTHTKSDLYIINE